MFDLCQLLKDDEIMLSIYLFCFTITFIPVAQDAVFIFFFQDKSHRRIYLHEIIYQLKSIIETIFLTPLYVLLTMYF